MSPRKYRAFISYSHADRRWGDWLHKALETYAIPKHLVGRATAAGTIPKRLAPVFRDRDELPSATDLGNKVNEALAQSDALVVICSPHSAASHWVDEEVREFKRLGGGERVFCLVVDGEPNASDLLGEDGLSREVEECFAPALRHHVDTDGQLTDERTEPIAADARPGKDGKTNAKLKLLSGLLDVGFDELRQRDQQRAHRRMAWVAGAALAGMIFTTGLAAFALQSRDHARFQREQAEALIGYMVGNLREKLNEVDRLDILDEVADHAMAYFDAQSGRDDDSGGRKRAEALSLVGQVRMDQGRLEDADKAFLESLRTAQAVAKRESQDAGTQMAVADAYSYMGVVAWMRGDLDAALGRFDEALPLVAAVVVKEPGNEDWQTSLFQMHNNRGHIHEARGQLRRALSDYRAALRIAGGQLKRHPDESEYQQTMADAHDAMAQLQYTLGDLANAERHYSAERELLRAIVRREPRNNRAKGNLAVADTFFAYVAEARGHMDTARASLVRARDTGESLLADDPGNMSKTGDLASYCRRLARNLRVGGDPAAAQPLLDQAERLYEAMLEHAPDTVRASSGQAATMLEQALLAEQLGNHDAAQDKAAQARIAYAGLLRHRKDDRSAAIGLASSNLLLGNIAQRRDSTDAAAVAWSNALSAMQGISSDSYDPDQLAVQGEVFHRLGRDREAQDVVARLDAMGYRDPVFLGWAKPASDSATPDLAESTR